MHLAHARSRRRSAATLKRVFGVETLLLEGGGTINGSLLAVGLVDEFSVVIAPALDGEAGADGIVAFEGGLKGKARLSLASVERLDQGASHLRYHVEPA